MDDIKSKEDIEKLVQSFYQEVQMDDLIGPIFTKQIKGAQWEKHLEKMISFWNTVLFNVKDYRGNPFSHHINLPIEQKHFDRWIELFTSVVHKNFLGIKANEAITRAEKMRIMFESKLNYIRNNPNQVKIL